MKRESLVGRVDRSRNIEQTRSWMFCRMSLDCRWKYKKYNRGKYILTGSKKCLFLSLFHCLFKKEQQNNVDFLYSFKTNIALLPLAITLSKGYSRRMIPGIDKF